jgi:hypothetical protein
MKPLDGYGHVIHNWFAVGRPPIVKSEHYFGKMASSLLEDGVTCIDLDKRNKKDNIEFIKRMSEPENHLKLCEGAYRRFNEVVNFKADSERIRDFLLSNLA